MTWLAWLDAQADAGGYTREQLDSARRESTAIPAPFSGEPIADDFDGCLSLTWRTPDATLTVDIVRDGTSEHSLFRVVSGVQ